VRQSGFFPKEATNKVMKQNFSSELKVHKNKDGTHHNPCEVDLYSIVPQISLQKGNHFDWQDNIVSGIVL
jgi:hypothetical protein